MKDMKAIVLISIAALALAANAHGQIHFYATLSGTNEVPPNTAPYTADGSFWLDGNVLTCVIGFKPPLFLPTSAGIYGPAEPGETGKLIFDLDLFIILNPLPGESGFGYAGTFTLARRQLDELKAGKLYVNVTSTAHPSGEIRGQILPVAATVGELCPCGGPWKNHGEYVNCVETVSALFVEEGLMSEVERKATIEQAAKSDCGKR